MNKSLKYLLIVASLLAIVIFWNSLTAPGVNDLPGNFREIDAWQNENNTGPVNRVYIVTLNDTLWQAMEAYGNYMPYAKLGTTKVWFFLEDGPFPTKITSGEVLMTAAYQEACVGYYSKNNMGQVTLDRLPFTD